MTGVRRPSIAHVVFLAVGLLTAVTVSRAVLGDDSWDLVAAFIGLIVGGSLFRATVARRR